MTDEPDMGELIVDTENPYSTTDDYTNGATVHWYPACPSCAWWRGSYKCLAFGEENNMPPSAWRGESQTKKGFCR